MPASPTDFTPTFALLAAAARLSGQLPVLIVLGLALVLLAVLPLVFPGVYGLVFKQMRQRALGTWLTLLSVLLGMSLAIAILLFERGGAALFAQTDYGYDVIVGTSRGSPLQLVLNSAYHIDRSPGNMPYWVYEELSSRKRSLPGQFSYLRHVQLAVPFAVGDTYKGRRIVATTPRMFGVDDAGNPIDLGSDPDKLPGSIFQYRPGRRYELAEGQVFHPKKFEAVIGSDVARDLGVKMGDKIRATHGDPGANEKPDEHAEEWVVVGVLKPTGTANDRVLFIPLISSYTIVEHKKGMEAHSAARLGQVATPSTTPAPAPAATQPATGGGGRDDHDHDHHHHEGYELAPDGTIVLKTPPEKWEISGVFIRSRSPIMGEQLMYHINNGGLPDVVAVNPASVMREFFQTFLAPGTQLLRWISTIVSVVAGVGILVSIYNSVAARTREIAILRALGATRLKVVLLICLEAGLIGLIGAVAGLVVGHAVGAVGSTYMRQYVGQGFEWTTIGWGEIQYGAFVVLLAVLAGLVPALKAYRTPVATNLVAA